MFLASEVIDILITIGVAGYILDSFTKGDLRQSFLLAGVSIVVHELSHKFMAMSFGFRAVYHASLSGLGMGVLFKLLGVPLFFVPAYVSISGSGSRLGYFLTALAGPLSNLAIFGLTTYFLNYLNKERWVRDNAEFINSIRLINLWLGLINLLPFPGTDGFNALTSLF